jgi:hypothetical protein
MAQVDGVEHHVLEHEPWVNIDQARILAVIEAGNSVAEAVYMKHGATAPDYCVNCGQGEDAPPPDNP